MTRRLIDVIGSAAILLVTLPIFLVTSLAIWCTDRGPAFYRQTRAGIHGRPFELIKFRSMRVNDLPAVVVGQVTVEHPMVTPIGRWIRRFKIDELPQLVNVVRGEMTLIGPRPTVLEQVEKYTPFQRRRLDMPPGMTGWTQVSGGVEFTWPERIMLDVWYIDHRSLWLDITILWRTFSVVLCGDRPDREALQRAVTYANQQSDTRQAAASDSEVRSLSAVNARS
jgi:lipopolysaccharide/colanic/teichoic acid biosynthesis glycosyltransferase